MAEAFLYGNNEEPRFPYEAVADAIKWVPEFVQVLTQKRGRNHSQAHLYSVLVNSILVFSRARTSAMFSNLHLSVCTKFVNRLNQTLSSLPADTGAAHHHMEIVRRNNISFFITCGRSPRFIWKQELTHREVGLNLDYAAAGHIGRCDGIRRGASICEISGHSHTQVVGEMVHLDQIAELVSIESFIERKTSLFNMTMIRLGLPYRFDYYWNSTRDDQSIKTTLQSDIPPSRQWWSENYLFLAMYPYDMAYASNESLFQKYWPVMKAAFQLAETLALSIKRPIPRECSKTVEDLFSKIYRTTQPPAAEGRVSASCNIEMVITSLLEEISKAQQSLHVIDERPPHERRAEDYGPRRSDFGCLIQVFFEWIRIHMLERRKLRPPLIHSGVMSLPSGGNERWTGAYKRTRDFATKLTDFYFEKTIPM